MCLFTLHGALFKVDRVAMLITNDPLKHNSVLILADSNTIIVMIIIYCCIPIVLSSSASTTAMRSYNKCSLN